MKVLIIIEIHHSITIIVKIRAYNQIPLLRKQLMKAAIINFDRFVRRKRTKKFLRCVMKLIDNESDLDPDVEPSLLVSRLSTLVSNAASQGWHERKFYQTVLKAHSQGSFRLNDRLQDAID